MLDIKYTRTESNKDKIRNEEIDGGDRETELEKSKI